MGGRGTRGGRRDGRSEMWDIRMFMLLLLRLRSDWGASVWKDENLFDVLLDLAAFGDRSS